MNSFVPGPVRRLEFDVGPSAAGHPSGELGADCLSRRASVLRRGLIAPSVGSRDEGKKLSDHFGVVAELSSHHFP